MADPDAEILLELHRIGGAMEVRAVSASDGLEVVFTAPSNASNQDVNQLARAKLAYVRSRCSTGDGDRPDTKGGIVI